MDKYFSMRHFNFSSNRTEQSVRQDLSQIPDFFFPALSADMCFLEKEKYTNN